MPDGHGAPLRIVVLGARGFIGSHVARLIVSQPDLYRGVFVSRRPFDASRSSSLAHWSSCDLVKATEAELVHLVEHSRADAVINCVGATEGERARMLQLNLLLVAKLVSALSSGPALVHLGSAAEYGPSAEAAPVRESGVARPAGYYGATKLAATEFVNCAATSGDLRGAVLRVFNAVGAGSPPWTLVGHAVAALREAMASRRPNLSLGRLDAARDFIDVRDVAYAALAAASKLAQGEGAMVVNIGRGIPVSSRWVVARLAEIARFEGKILEEEEDTSPRSGNSSCQWADITAAGKVLGWRPRYLLADALTEAWASSAGPAEAPAAEGRQNGRYSAAPVLSEEPPGRGSPEVFAYSFESFNHRQMSPESLLIGGRNKNA